MKSATDQIVRCPKCGAANRVSGQNKTKLEPVCGQCKTALSGLVHPIVLTDANFSGFVELSPLPVMIDFWAAWCGPCRIILPIIESLAEELRGRVRIAKIDVDQNPQTSSRFRIQSIPTLLILQNGKEVDRIVGAGTKEGIIKRLQPYLSK